MVCGQFSGGGGGGGGQFSSLAIIRGAIFLGGNCPGTFLMVTHLFLFIHDVLYAHIMYILLKNCYVLHKKLCCATKKYFT